jgi:hypothetical protein
MTMKIKCPQCGIEGSMSLLDAKYEGPYKCWKCRALFKICLIDGELKSCEPLTEDEFDRLRELHTLKNKFKKDD